VKGVFVAENDKTIFAIVNLFLTVCDAGISTQQEYPLIAESQIMYVGH